MPINPPPPAQAPPLKANQGRCLSFIVNNLFSHSLSSTKQKQVSLEVFLVSELLQKTKTSKEANDVWEKSKKLADLAKIGPSSEVEYRTSIKYVNRNENIELRPKLYVKKIYPQGGKI